MFNFDPLPPEKGIPFRLVTGQTLVLGRNRFESDVVAWILPRNEANDRLTRLISQVHTILELEGGDQIRIRDADSASGTFWNQVPVPEGIGMLTGGSGSLCLGSNFEIRLSRVPGGVAFSPITPEGWPERSVAWLFEPGMKLTANGGALTANGETGTEVRLRDGAIEFEDNGEWRHWTESSGPEFGGVTWKLALDE